MLTNYYTLSALAGEWSSSLPGATIADAHSPARDELSIDVVSGNDSFGIRVSVQPGFHFMYRADRAGRPRANVTTLFDEAIGSVIESVAMHPTDRILTVTLADRRRFEIHLYGARANVLLVSEASGRATVEMAFKQSDRLRGHAPPTPRDLSDSNPASELSTDGDASLSKRVSKLWPRLGGLYVREVLFRAGFDHDTTSGLDSAEIDKVLDEVSSFLKSLRAPSPVRYRIEDEDIFSLTALSHLGASQSDSYESVDEGVRFVARTRARIRQLETIRAPILKALERSRDRSRKKLSDLEKAAATPSRADRYESWATLLMANPTLEITGESVVVPDLLGDGSDVTIPVKPRLSAVENAERYYGRARDVRHERAGIASRIESLEGDVRTLDTLIEEADHVSTAREMERFRKQHASELARFVSGQGGLETQPFRRFRITGDLEVWVGRNARENDLLTFDHASPHDVWLHARGTPGSHVVIRVPGRNTVVGKEAREEAAAIAAWFSSARGSGLVPVIVTEKKYVSKPRGSNPGAVRIQRESVLMVEPRLPE